MDNNDKPAKVNQRKAVADLVRGSTAKGCESSGGQVGVVSDPTNPYAFVVEVGGQRFRVLVKELAGAAD